METKSKKYRYRRSEEHTSELQSHLNLVCRLLLENKNFRRVCARNMRVYLCVCVVMCVSECLSIAVVAVIVMCISVFGFRVRFRFFFFFSDRATTEIYPLSLHDVLPI